MIRRLLLLALLLAAPGLAPTLAWGRALKLATWNLEWLTLRTGGDPLLPEDVRPKTAADRALLRRYARYLDADVIALQEVDGPAVAAEIFPPDRYALYFTGDHVIQRVGFAVRRGLLVRQNPDLVALDVQPEARFPLRSGADISISVDGQVLRLLAVHLKTGCHDQPLPGPSYSCRLLDRQIAPMQGWIAQRRRDGAPFVLLGDFNRRMDKPEEMEAALGDAAPLLRATAGHGSPCWGGGSFIDHIFLGGAARGWLQPESLRVLTYREPAAEKERLSDHCAVSIELQLPR